MEWLALEDDEFPGKELIQAEALQQFMVKDVFKVINGADYGEGCLS